MTLYWYVQNKDEVLDLVADRVLAGVAIPPPECRVAGRRPRGGALRSGRPCCATPTPCRCIVGRGSFGPNGLTLVGLGPARLPRGRIQRRRRGRRLLRRIQLRQRLLRPADRRGEPFDAPRLRYPGLLPDGAQVHRGTAGRPISGPAGRRSRIFSASLDAAIRLRPRMSDRRSGGTPPGGPGCRAAAGERAASPAG